ncbi:MAG: FumA C-terminus/TtdB family hydratase beta subunit [Nitrospiraceae bacterium]|nr:FumA C-terminus/TtdB family hydratase beta subunit [Nitrospirota bacterium]MDA8340405.1 FumA C-terminus/TtdB family hydratase beta subunit [Nitrospiraceae bacterium]
MVNPESEILNPKSLNTPLSKEDVLNLKVGDMVLISGQIVTGRDKIHKFLVHERPDKKDIPFELHGGIIYHCGPIIKKIDDTYTLIAAGPTTSMRVEMYEAEVIKTYGIRGIIGKGGMGEKTLNAMKEQGCVYFHTISGAAAYLADRIKNVRDGWKIEEFGAPEAMWLLEAEDFPAIVTMDAHGNSLHRDIEKISLRRLKEIIG